MMFGRNSKNKDVNSYVDHPNLSTSTRRIAKGVYETVFECQDGQLLVLRVDCRSDVRVSLFGMRVNHPLVDADSNVRIAAGKLLGAAIHDVVLQLQLNPPEILQFTEPKVRDLQKMSSQIYLQQGDGSGVNSSAPDGAVHSERGDSSFLSNSAESMFPFLSTDQQSGIRTEEQQSTVENTEQQSRIANAVPMHEVQAPPSEQGTVSVFEGYSLDYKDQVRPSQSRHQRIPTAEAILVVDDNPGMLLVASDVGSKSAI